jgi:uncharacterized membrane protein
MTTTHKFITLSFSFSFILIGISHFIYTEWFEPIVPETLGNSSFWIYLSGFFEIFLGISLLSNKQRKKASFGLVILLIMLYFANLNMWINDISLGGVRFTLLEHIIRFFIQIILILLALYIGNFEFFDKIIKSKKRKKYN